MRSRSKTTRASNTTARARKSTTQVRSSPAFPLSKVGKDIPASVPPSRAHTAAYHYPLLLDSPETCAALLKWFDRIYEERAMPWRKRWDPELSEEERGRRAYEVWVSEIMLQQTRVSTVIPYFTSWIARWPTIHALAAAPPSAVLAAWKGLGYYSRATRLQQGAAAMLAASPDAANSVPAMAKELMAFPGIGRYTAGAISSIAFGKPEAVLDGNVVRVLCRQLGLCADGKEKKVTDVLWGVAEKLVRRVSARSQESGDECGDTNAETRPSAIPGSWNQALMELGSTICAPRPKCGECPIQATCRAYSESLLLLEKRAAKAVVPEAEDACSMCEPLDIEDLLATTAEPDFETAPVKAKKRKVAQTNKISQYFAIGTPDTEGNDAIEDEVGTETRKKRKTPAADAKTPSISATYCSLFPKKTLKTKVKEEACVVCMIELQGDEQSFWLIEQRPAKGLLASLWQFPQATLSDTDITDSSRRSAAEALLSSLCLGDTNVSTPAHISSFPPLVHVFTHIRLVMYAYHYRVGADKGKGADLRAVPGPPAREWVATNAMGDATLSTGMRRCWELANPL